MAVSTGRLTDTCGMYPLTGSGPVMGHRAAALVRPATRRIGGLPFAPYLWNVGTLAALYYGSAQLGIQFEFTGPIAAIVWLPAGVAISYLSLRGIRYWPGALVGDILVNHYVGIPITAMVGQTSGNLVEVLLGAYLVRRLLGRGSPLDSVRGVIAILGALASGTLASAVIGPLSLLAAGSIHGSELESVARTWWLGDACGALVVVPLALAWFGPEIGAHTRLPLPSMIAALVGVGLCAWLATRGASAIAYLALPPLILVAIRFGSRGASVAVALTATLATWATTHYGGPFTYLSITHSVLITQMFIAVSAITALLVVALSAEREHVVDRLNKARLAVVGAQYAERRRIERNLHDGLQQRLFALVVQLAKAKQFAADEQVRQTIESAQLKATAAMAELSELSRGHAPAVLNELGLAEALRRMAEESVVPRVLLELPEESFGEEVEECAYYVVAEALANAQRHAGASTVRVQIALTSEDVQIVVEDDGAGGAREARGASDSGLGSLRQRTESLGGSLHIESPARGGTRIAAVIPRTSGS